MTETTTEITPAVKAGKIALSKDKGDLTSVVRAMVGAPNADSGEEIVLKAPTKPVLSEDQRTAVEELTSLVGDLSLPATVRAMTEGELANLTTTRIHLDSVDKVVKDTKEAIREAVFIHYDEVARQEGSADDTTPVDGKGHYILEDKESARVPGLDKKFTREVSSASVAWGTTQTEADALKKLVDDGLLDKETYLAVTRQTRVVDEHALYLAMKANEALLPVIQKALSTKKAASSSLNLRNA